jgi:hypothetical protein
MHTTIRSHLLCVAFAGSCALPLFAASPPDPTPASTYARMYLAANRTSDAQVADFCQMLPCADDAAKCSEIKQIVSMVIAAGKGVTSAAAPKESPPPPDVSKPGEVAAPAPAPAPVAAPAAAGGGTSGTKDVTDTQKNPTTVLPNASINTSSNLNLVTTTLFTGTIRVANYRPGLTLSASAATSKPSSTTTTRYSDVQMLIPEGAALGLYLSPFNLAPVHISDPQKDSSTPSPGFADRRQVVDRYYLRHNSISSTTDSSTQINEIDDPITLVYIRNGVGAKVVNRSQDPAAASTSTTPSSGTQPSTTADYGLAGSAYLGLGADGGLLSLNSATAGGSKTTTAGAFRIEGLLTATWTDKKSVLALYPNASSQKDLFFGAYGRFSLSLNSNVKLSIQYAYPFGNSKGYTGKALLFGATVSQ